MLCIHHTKGAAARPARSGGTVVLAPRDSRADLHTVKVRLRVALRRGGGGNPKPAIRMGLCVVSAGGNSHLGVVSLCRIQVTWLPGIAIPVVYPAAVLVRRFIDELCEVRFDPLRSRSEICHWFDRN